MYQRSLKTYTLQILPMLPNLFCLLLPGPFHHSFYVPFCILYIQWDLQHEIQLFPLQSLILVHINKVFHPSILKIGSLPMHYL